MKHLLLLPITVVWTLVASSCSLGESGIQLSQVDITGAKALIGARGSLARVSGGTISERFFKLTSSDAIVPVECRATDGSVVEVEPPHEIYDAGPEYLILVFDRPYLVSRTSGATYDLSSVGAPTKMVQESVCDGPPRKCVYWDSDGRIYYLSGSRVKRLDVADPNRIVAVNWTPDVDPVQEFAVDNQGNVLYRYDDHRNSFGKRLKKTNGALYSLEYNWWAFWTGLDGLLYDVQSNPPGGIGGIVRLEVASDFSVSAMYKPGYAPLVYAGYFHDWLYFNDRIVAICDESYELDNPAHAARPLTFPFLHFSVRKIIRNSENFWYVATRDGAIIRVNPIDDTYETIVSPDSYDIGRMSVSADDTIMFSGLRLSDATKVLAMITSDGALQIISAGPSTDVTVLRRID